MYLLQNAPQYIATMDVGDRELDLQYRVHAALDVVEEKCAQQQLTVKTSAEARDLYLGILYSTDQYKMCVRLICECVTIL